MVMDRAGNLFGITSLGGAHGAGTVFELAKGSRVIDVLASFAAGASTEPSDGLTIDAQGNLYGLIEPDLGLSLTAFELPNGSHKMKTIATLSSDFGGFSWGPMALDGKGNFFGTLEGGPDRNGAVFEIPRGSRKGVILASFPGRLGIPEGGLIIDGSGDLFGTYSNSANPSSFGGIFEVVPGSGTMTPIAACDGTVTGRYPVGKLARGPNGTLYGTTYAGGTNDVGTVFSFVAPFAPPTPEALTITQQPVVTHHLMNLTANVSDAEGNIVTSGVFSVTLRLPPGDRRPFTPVTVTTIDGTATFNNIPLPKKSGSYRFQLLEGILAPVSTRAVVVKAGESFH